MDSRVDLVPVLGLLNTVRIPADRVVTLHSGQGGLVPAGSGLLPNTVLTPVDRGVTHPSGTRTLDPAPALVRSGQMWEEIRLSVQALVPVLGLLNTVRILAVPESETCLTCNYLALTTGALFGRS